MQTDFKLYRVGKTEKNLMNFVLYIEKGPRIFVRGLLVAMANELCRIIREVVEPNFLNIRTSIQTYDRDAMCYGAPC